jgi:hypothetical protein
MSTYNLQSHLYDAFTDPTSMLPINGTKYFPSHVLDSSYVISGDDKCTKLIYI